MKFLSPKEIAEVLNICYEDALALVKYSGIKFVKIGRLYRVECSEFEKMLAIGEMKVEK